MYQNDIQYLQAAGLNVEGRPWGFHLSHRDAAGTYEGDDGIEHDWSESFSVCVNGPPARWFFRYPGREMVEFIASAYANVLEGKFDSLIAAMEHAEREYDYEILAARLEALRLSYLTCDERVAESVSSAFQGVALGNGIGLYEAQGIDDSVDPEFLKACPYKDEKDDWSRIPVPDLNRCYAKLSSFDAEGMRFYLPAYLIADLERKLKKDIINHLAYHEGDAMLQFALLNAAQRGAVRQFLVLRMADPNRKFDRPLIEKSLADYWTAGG